LAEERKGPHGKKKRCCNNIFNALPFGIEKTKTRKCRRMVKLDFSFPKLILLGIHSKNHYIHFLAHGHSSWSTFGLHLMRDPKTLSIDLLSNRTMKVGPWKKAIFQGLTSWSMVYTGSKVDSWTHKI
jgi:hypothetical protein